MSTGRKIAIGVLLLLIISLGGVAIYTALDLSQEEAPTVPGGTTGDVPVADEGDLGVGATCSPSNDQCGEGLFCLADDGSSGRCKEAVVGGRSCTSLVAFKCVSPGEWTPAGSFVAGSTGGESACTLRPVQVDSWQEGLDYIDGCGQVDLVWDDTVNDALGGGGGALCDQSFRARRDNCGGGEPTTLGAQVYCSTNTNQKIPLPGVTVQYTYNQGDGSAVQTFDSVSNNDGWTWVSDEYNDATWAINITDFPSSNLVPGTSIAYSDLTLQDTNCEDCESANPYISQVDFPACTTDAGPAGFTGEFGNCPVAAGSTATAAEFVFSGCDEAIITPAQCENLQENGPDPVSSAADNIVEYTLTYTNSETGDPYPNIRLRVSADNGSTIVGRDANSTSSQLVAPSSRSTNGDTKVYQFEWEALNTDDSTINAATYNVDVLLDGSSQVVDASACTETITIEEDVQQEPVFSIVKSGSEVCLADESARIDYQVTVTNIGPVEGTFDTVTDTPDSTLVNLGVTPSNINPTYGTFASGVITWTGDASDRTLAPGATMSYSYSMVLPSSLVSNFQTVGVDNEAQVNYDDDSSSFSLNVPITCTVTSTTGGTTGVTQIPDTALDDSGVYILGAVMMMLLGVLVYKTRFGSGLLLSVYKSSPFASFEEKIEREFDRDN